MISMQSRTLQDLQYSYCAAIFVVFMRDEAKESLAIVLTTSRCHFDEMVTAHRNEVLISFCQRSCGRLFLSLGSLIPGSDFVTKVKQINSQSDLISMSSFAGPSSFLIRSSVYIC